jgi:hypothetical protein
MGLEERQPPQPTVFPQAEGAILPKYPAIQALSVLQKSMEQGGQMYNSASWRPPCGQEMGAGAELQAGSSQPACRCRSSPA